MSAVIEIFDSLTHPTIDGAWLNPRFSGACGLDELVAGMRRHGVKKAFAVGMGGVGGYSAQGYIRFVRAHANLIPVAFCEPDYTPADLEELKALGYAGIKIHPRISGIAPDDDRIFGHIRHANRIGLCVLYCGFLGATEKFAGEIGEERLIFLHAGGRDILRVFDLLRSRENILLDLSYTIMRYPDVWENIVRLCEARSERFCVGSDHPEVTHRELREGFDALAARIGRAGAARIGSGNLEKFITHTGSSHGIASGNS